MEQHILVFAGMIVIFIGIALILIGSLSGGEGRAKFAVGGFIGPIPFGFANDKGLMYLVIAISLIMLLVFILAGHRIFI